MMSNTLVAFAFLDANLYYDHLKSSPPDMCLLDLQKSWKVGIKDVPLYLRDKIRTNLLAC